jgi:hypothetical protein
MRWWIRAYLILGALQAILIGGRGLLVPAETPIPLDVTPLNARFIAALYLAAAVGLVLSVLVRDRADARLFVITFGLATTFILLLSILYWNDFLGADRDHRLGWIWSYVIDPPLAALVIFAGRLVPARTAAYHRLTPLFLVEAAVLGVLGVMMLAAPAIAARGWPWALPPRLSQLYACFFLAFALGALLTAREQQGGARRNFTIASFALMAFVIVASLLHVNRFQPGLVSWVWFGGFLLGACTLALAWIWQVRAFRSNRKTAAALP